MTLKQEYIKKNIELLSACNDITMLDFIMQLLTKTNAKTPTTT